MKKVILLILDGFGIRNEKKGNAVKQAETPELDNLMSSFPCSELLASGEAVGLPKGQIGNSEVGHMTIGSGRTTMQTLSYLNEKIKTKDFFENQELIDTMEFVNTNNSTLHLIGLLSNGGVHSSANHFYAVLALAKLRKVRNVVFHFITDGRDTAPRSAKQFIDGFLEKAKKFNLGKIGTISGRYYSMDRDTNWDRIKKAYDAMVFGLGNEFANPDRCLDLHYKNNINDEFINPSIITKGCTIKENDGVIFVNFRPERMKQMIEAFTEQKFTPFKTVKYKNVKFCSIFKLHPNITHAYEDAPIENCFGEYLASIDYKQARISETEKYAHVTYFFDGGKDFSDNNCAKIQVLSPKVPTYDLKPEMSVGEVTEAVLEAIDDDFDFILVNFANPDMVGHTGNLEAAIRAIEICDFCVGKIYEKAKENFYELVITADHGNSELMLNEQNEAVTSHTTSKVPFIICNNEYKIKSEGELKDVIPTIIDIFGISKPIEMTGESLIIND